MSPVSRSVRRSHVSRVCPARCPASPIFEIRPTSRLRLSLCDLCSGHLRFPRKVGGSRPTIVARERRGGTLTRRCDGRAFCASSIRVGTLESLREFQREQVRGVQGSSGSFDRISRTFRRVEGGGRGGRRPLISAGTRQPLTARPRENPFA